MRSEHVVEFFDLVVFGQVGEFREEALEVVEVLGSEKVEQVKELFEVVLERGAGQEDFVFDGVVDEDPKEFGLIRFEAMSFVDDKDLPVD
jgi:hypothetical protein